MNENNITISVYEYRALLIAAEKVAICERICKQDGYVSTGDLKAVLGIEDKKGEQK
jgi:hypothetical protein